MISKKIKKQAKTFNKNIGKDSLKSLQKYDNNEHHPDFLHFLSLIDIVFPMTFVTFIVYKICPFFSFKYFLLVYYFEKFLFFIIYTFEKYFYKKIMLSFIIMDFFVNYIGYFICILILFFTNVLYVIKISNLIFSNDIYMQLAFILSLITILFIICVAIPVCFKCCITKYNDSFGLEKSLYDQLLSCYMIFAFLYSILITFYFKILITTSYSFYIMSFSCCYIIFTSLFHFLILKGKYKDSIFLTGKLIVFIYKFIFVVFISNIMFYEYYLTIEGYQIFNKIFF